MVAAVVVSAVVVWEEESVAEEVLMRLAGGEVGSVVVPAVIGVVVVKCLNVGILGTIEREEREKRRRTTNIDLLREGGRKRSCFNGGEAGAKAKAKAQTEL